MKFTFIGIYQEYGDWYGNAGMLAKLTSVNQKDMTVGSTVDPSGLQGPPGSSLLHCNRDLP